MERAGSGNTQDGDLGVMMRRRERLGGGEGWVLRMGGKCLESRFEYGDGKEEGSYGSD